MDAQQHGPTRTSARREVSLDSQCQESVGGSLANSRLTLSSRGGTPVSLGGPQVDESVQVDLSAADTITYDSDDEMVVKRRASLLVLRNKKGHPIYSREDIREQYCINRKEVEVLESARSLKFLGCFSSPQDGSSPCTKNSLLFSCMHKKKQRRSSSDENVYGGGGGGAYDAESRCSTDDEDYGFRKRPKTFYTEPSRSDAGSVASGSRKKLESSASFGSCDESEADFLARNARRPTELDVNNGPPTQRNERFQPSRSVDELTEPPLRHPTLPRSAKTPDILDDRRQKHVSFDNGSLVRSNTVAGGLEEVGGPAATSTPLGGPRRNRSQERLLDAARPPHHEFGERPTSVMSVSRYLEMSSGSRYGSLLLRPRKALMRTQATQTEMTFRAKSALPAYLTLSPRARARPRHRSAGPAQRHRRQLVSDDSDEEVMEVDLSTKQQRLVRSSTSRASIRRQRAIEDEIMMTYKRAPSPPPKGPVEVLIGDRPVSRTLDREHRKISSICREVAPLKKRESQEDFLERSNAVEITITSCMPKTPQRERPKEEEKQGDKNLPPKPPPKPKPKPAPKKEPPPPLDPVQKGSSEEKPSPEESSEVSGMRSPSKRGAPMSRDTSSAKSSSESSRHRMSQPEWMSSSAEGSCSCQDYFSFDDSLTVTTTDEGSSLSPEIRQALETAEKRRQEYLDKYREVKAKRDDPTSPDSESSSSIFTERETSRSEVTSTSSSKAGKSETEEEESSEYVTATDHSPQRPALDSSPSSGKLMLTAPDVTPTHSNGSPRPAGDSDDLSTYFSATLPPDDMESSDESTKKETPPTTPSTESEGGHTPLHKLPHDTTSGTPDSDRTSDITALFDPSPEPQSSLQEPQTVIEIRSEATSEEILNDDDDMDRMDDEDSFPQGGNGSRAGSESSESSSLLLSGLNEVEAARYGLQGGAYPALDIRKAADELSTVSEVSEESSRNAARVRRKKSDRKASETSSHSEGVRLDVTRGSSPEYIQSETTTPDSTTSGSFVLDNGSLTESCNSLSNDRTSRTAEDSKETEDSKAKTESESPSESCKLSKSSKTPLPGDEDSSTKPGAASPSDLSEKLVSLTLSSSSKEWDQPPLSAWCSEGAIPKHRHPDGEPTAHRRRKDRARNKSEPREHVTSMQFSRADRCKSRSKSRSPEKLSGDEDGSWFRCSHCGAHPPPRSAPPDWERYPRFWEPPPALLWHRHHRDYHRDYRHYGSSYCHIPRSWSTESSAAGGGNPGEVDMYADDDEDAGVHSESYRSSSWVYISDSDELAVWRQSSNLKEASGGRPLLNRSDSTESTSSEHEFLKQYQMVTHRMIQRKCSVEMYKRIANRCFDIDKKVIVQRNNGEFGFRIHGNRPVVVSAIEKGTPAESCGLEVGDIIISINGLNVLDAPHGDVVRLAHTGTEVLKMEVSRTCHVLTPVLTDSPPPPVFCGHLQRLSARSVTGRRWCRRWFAVKLDGVLYWYRTNKDHEPLGALGLQNQTISRVPEAGAPHAFKVSKFGESTYYFSADDEDTATRWISALNQVAATASRVDPYVDESLRNAQLPPISIPHVDCHGPLSKFSQRWKGWRRRYFLLKDASLYFYTDRNAKVALGLFQLHGYKVQSSSLQGQKNAFEAVPPEPKLKHLYFLADSENEKKRWLSALDYSIDRWIKIG